MLVAAYAGPGQGLKVEERAIPVPTARQVVIKVGRCGVCGTDVHLTDGVGYGQVPIGFVLGHEYTGEVVDVGPQVQRLRVGDRLSALAISSCGRCPTCLDGEPQWCASPEKMRNSGGGYGQFALVNEPQAVKIPHSLSWEDAALVEPLSVGLHGVNLAELQRGEDIAIIGAGPVAMSVLHWARRRGADQIVVEATSRRRQRYAMAMGATAFMVSSNSEDAVEEALGGQPRLVFETAGVPGTLERAMKLTKPRGTVLALGFCTTPDTFVPAIYMMKQIRVQFSMTYSVAEFRQVISSLDSGDSAPRTMISQTVSLAKLPEVFESLRGSSQDCKVMIDPWS